MLVMKCSNLGCRLNQAGLPMHCCGMLKGFPLFDTLHEDWSGQTRRKGSPGSCTFDSWAESVPERTAFLTLPWLPLLAKIPFASQKDRRCVALLWTCFSNSHVKDAERSICQAVQLHLDFVRERGTQILPGNMKRIWMVSGWLYCWVRSVLSHTSYLWGSLQYSRPQNWL